MDEEASRFNCPIEPAFVLCCAKLLASSMGCKDATETRFARLWIFRTPASARSILSRVRRSSRLLEWFVLTVGGV